MTDDKGPIAILRFNPDAGFVTARLERDSGGRLFAVLESGMRFLLDESLLEERTNAETGEPQFRYSKPLTFPR
jgi:hypothetical protein